MLVVLPALLALAIIVYCCTVEWKKRHLPTKMQRAMGLIDPSEMTPSEGAKVVPHPHPSPNPNPNRLR